MLKDPLPQAVPLRHETFRRPLPIGTDLRMERFIPEVVPGITASNPYTKESPTRGAGDLGLLRVITQRVQVPKNLVHLGFG